MKRRIVLAGGSGFLGRLLAEWLQGRGFEVIVHFVEMAEAVRDLEQRLARASLSVCG